MKLTAQVTSRTRLLLLAALLAASVLVLLPSLSLGFATISPIRHNPSKKQQSFRMSTAETTDAPGVTTIDRPFGAWKSPITSQSITAGSIRMGGLHVSTLKTKRGGESRSGGGGGDTVYWLEGRPLEGGRNVFCKWKGDEIRDEIRDEIGDEILEITPPETNVRTRVHEYGGAASVIAGSTLYFVDFDTQQLNSLPLDVDVDVDVDEREPVTVTKGPPMRYRYADVIYDEARKVLICVREDHGPEGTASPKDVANEIVAIDVGTSGEQNFGREVVLVKGPDFVAAPRLSNDGKTLACIVWDHPNMPWDATKLVIVDDLPDKLFEEDVSLAELKVIAGQDGDTSVMQPLYHPDTGALLYISDESGFYNLYSNYGNNSGGGDVSILPMAVDFGGVSPGWMLGQMGYSILEDGRLAATITREGSSVLLVLDVANYDPAASGKPVDYEEFTAVDGLPMQFGSVSGGSGGDLYFMGGDPSTPSSIYRWNMNERGPAVILKTSSTTRFDESVISVPRQIEFPTTLGTAFGYYYAPKNGGFVCTTEKAPPLLVKAHGGPTSAAGTSFNAGIQYWTSRGFAVLDVDYGGSTGYGREYRRRLRKSWGIVDIDDVCNGAKYLVEEGLADGDKLCIDGGSAGGYTTLGALAFRDVFKAGCSLYGVADLSLLASDTHKFESRYLDGLVGKYPEEKEIYERRSPLASVDTLSCPILLLQGDEDKIVPPNQAECMHKALLKKGIPTCLKIYKGEQHGFRKSENIEDALDSELSFYGTVFGIDIPDAIDLEIDNMQ